MYKKPPGNLLEKISKKTSFLNWLGGLLLLLTPPFRSARFPAADRHDTISLLDWFAGTLQLGHVLRTDLRRTLAAVGRRPYSHGLFLVIQGKFVRLGRVRHSLMPAGLGNTIFLLEQFSERTTSIVDVAHEARLHGERIKKFLAGQRGVFDYFFMMK